MSQTALILLSGGVDSAVAAALLKRQGYETVGLTLRLKPLELASNGDNEADIKDARSAAEALGIRHIVLDNRDKFQREVVGPFLDAYASGLTPNPCVLCNPRIKFAAAAAVADDLGIAMIASGHYARLAVSGAGKLLMKAADLSRDQSYFLYRLPDDVLRRLIFPLGSLTKREVRLMAGELALPVAGKKDSQEICFIPGGGTAAYLDAKLAPEAKRPGEIRMPDGRVIGRHGGIHAFTVGQRKGLGVATGEPLYVTAINEVGGIAVGPERDLMKRRFFVHDIVWHVPPSKEGFLRAKVRIRFKHREAPAEIRPLGGKADITFDEAQRAVTPGQSAVFYRDDVVIGGGIIEA